MCLASVFGVRYIERRRLLGVHGLHVVVLLDPPIGRIRLATRSSSTRARVVARCTSWADSISTPCRSAPRAASTSTGGAALKGSA